MNLEDGRGVGEPLNEKDPNGNGLRITASYYL